MFKAVELPAAVADLDPGLANVDGQALPHDVSKVQKNYSLVRGWCKVVQGATMGARLVQGAPRTRD